MLAYGYQPGLIYVNMVNRFGSHSLSLTTNPLRCVSFVAHSAQTQPNPTQMPLLCLGFITPDFEPQSTAGPIKFHEWISDLWAVLFSHLAASHLYTCIYWYDYPSASAKSPIPTPTLIHSSWFLVSQVCMTELGEVTHCALRLGWGFTPLWLLEPVDGPGGETRSKICAVTPGPVRDLLEDSVPPTCSTIQDKCHQVLEYGTFALFHRFRGLVTCSLSR